MWPFQLSACRQWLTNATFQVDLLEQDVLAVLSLVRSTKNTFAPINQIPPEALSLIAHYCDTDEGLISLTHVCRSWREMFISHASLWTKLDCTVVEKTRVYLKRSKMSPLDIRLRKEGFLQDAFLLTLPHLDRLGSLSTSGSLGNLSGLIEHLGSPAPLLKTLSLTVADGENVALQDTIFGGDISSLHTLRLDGVISNLAWENMSNLRTFSLHNVPVDNVSVTRLLNFFERAPLLRKIRLDNAFPNSSDAPPGRVVSLPNLKYLKIVAHQPHAILMDHLSIPTGASISQSFHFSDNESPILLHLPKDLGNLEHLSNVASINLNFTLGVYLRLQGPSGGHYMIGEWNGQGPVPISVDPQVLQSLGVFPTSAVERLAITQCQYITPPSVPVEESRIYNTFQLMNRIRTLTLTACLNLPFAQALNPKKNEPGTIVCPQLEELFLYIKKKEWFCIGELLEMAEERASKGAKLDTITITSEEAFLPTRKVLELRNHVSHVDYKLDHVIPKWDAIPNDIYGADDESDD